MIQKSILQRILNFPLTKILVGLIACGGAFILAQFAINLVLESTDIDGDMVQLIGGAIGVGLSLTAYVYLFQWFEKRIITELSKVGMVRSLVLGILLGTFLQSLTILVMYLKGAYVVESINPISFILPPLAMSFVTAILEEILFRGIIFRILENSLGSYFALFISAILFGLIHMFNPNASLLVSIGLAIQAGLLLAVAFIYTRNLWFPIAIHFAWNFAQSALFGARVSGHTIPKTLIDSSIEGADWLTGGGFGPEGSIQATLFCLITTIILLGLSIKKGNLIMPYWKQETNPVVIK